MSQANNDGWVEGELPPLTEALTGDAPWTVEGTWQGDRKVQTGGRTSYIYVVRDPEDGEVEIWGSTLLRRLVEHNRPEIGDQVRIRSLGTRRKRAYEYSLAIRRQDQAAKPPSSEIPF